MKIVLISILTFYKKLLSPIFVAFFGHACRFTPSCSEYTIEALEKYGVVDGLKLGLKRLRRCNPWGGLGYDPVK